MVFYATDAGFETKLPVRSAETRERRGQPWFSAQFRSRISGEQLEEGQGRTLDVSARGCKIESEVTVEPGMALECRIHIPGLDRPLRRDEAEIKWRTGTIFGVLFTCITSQEFEKLKRVLTELEREQSGACLMRNKLVARWSPAVSVAKGKLLK